jgi:hypothetical protein
VGDSAEQLHADGTGSHRGQQRGATAKWAKLLRIRSEYYFECIAGREGRSLALALQLEKAAAAAEAAQRGEDDAAAASAASAQEEAERRQLRQMQRQQRQQGAPVSVAAASGLRLPVSGVALIGGGVDTAAGAAAAAGAMPRRRPATAVRLRTRASRVAHTPPARWGAHGDEGGGEGEGRWQQQQRQLSVVGGSSQHVGGGDGGLGAAAEDGLLPPRGPWGWVAPEHRRVLATTRAAAAVQEEEKEEGRRRGVHDPRGRQQRRWRDGGGWVPQEQRGQRLSTSSSSSSLMVAAVAAGTQRRRGRRGRPHSAGAVPVLAASSRMSTQRGGYGGVDGGAGPDTPKHQQSGATGGAEHGHAGSMRLSTTALLGSPSSPVWPESLLVMDQVLSSYLHRRQHHTSRASHRGRGM